MAPAKSQAGGDGCAGDADRQGGGDLRASQRGHIRQTTRKREEEPRRQQASRTPKIQHPGRGLAGPMGDDPLSDRDGSATARVSCPGLCPILASCFAPPNPSMDT